jgi:Holliday junction resolvase-like predicted endonuclease
MAKVSKNAKAAQRLQSSGGKDFTMVVVPVKNPKTGKYSYKTQMVHKDKVNDIMKAAKD